MNFPAHGSGGSTLSKYGRILILSLLSVMPSIVFGQSNDVKDENTKKGILLLGSGNIETLRNRSEIALKLYKSSQDIDYIIVSGGCNAHGSGICEATEMAKYLQSRGVPETLIIKEEKSQSTAQNYCYSRLLTDQTGEKIMQAGDSVLVVSNHWHAFSVAGCLTDNDKINAFYHIEGNIRPQEKDDLDYGSIYKNCTENADYCKTILNGK